MTSIIRSDRARKQLASVLDDLERNGYEVLREPASISLPWSLRDFRPDAIARRGEQVVVVEFLTKGQAREAHLQQLADVISREPSWRLELIWAGDEDPPVPRDSNVQVWVQRAMAVVELSFEAALLSLWVGVEVALGRRGLNEGITQFGGSSSRLIGELFSRGVLSDRQYTLLIETRDARNSIAHGARTSADPTIDVSEVAELALWLSHSSFVPTDQMVDDFLKDYEDPANSTPYDSREGGYQYVLGGPFDASQVLADKYDRAPQADIEDAAERLNMESTEWVPRG